MKPKKTTETWMVRQGDVFLERIDTLPTGAVEEKREPGGVVLAHGESTGHAHRVKRRARGFSVGAERFLVVLRGGAEVTHEEHDAIKLPAGNYRVVRQVEYSPGELPRTVAD